MIELKKDKASLRKELKLITLRTPESLLQNAQVIIKGYNAGSVGLYVPIEAEPDLLPLIAMNPAIKFCLPRIINDELVYVSYTIGDKLLQNPSFPKIAEPVSQEVVRPEMIFVPQGSAFDLKGYRLGRGGGHYDKYLAKYPQIKAIGVSFAQNIQERLPREEHDRRMHYIVTEHMVLQT